MTFLRLCPLPERTGRMGNHGAVTSTRLITFEDVPALTELLKTNREFMAPFEPARREDYYTQDGQHAVTERLLGLHGQGTSLPHVIVDDESRIIGRITLNEIVRGPLQSCSLGYWVSAAENGRGLATSAVKGFLRVAFDELDLHRVQAGTLVGNHRSQRVLEKNGFCRYGLAPNYLLIAGEWRDHILFQVINPRQAVVTP